MRYRGGKISIQNKTLLISLLCIFFICVGSVAAADVNNDVNNINLNDTDVSKNLEVSSEDSISETNLVNSHNDNLNNYPKVNSINEDNVNDAISTESSSNDGDDVLVHNNKDAATEGSKVGSSPGGDADPEYKISVHDMSMAYGDQSVFNATITNADGTPAKGVSVLFQIDGESKTYTRTTNDKGIASITINRNLGKHTMITSIKDDPSISAEATITIAKEKYNVITENLEMVYGSSSNFKTTVTYADGSPVKGATVKYQIAGESRVYTRTTDEKGVASIAINRPVGKYTMSTTVTIEDITINRNNTIDIVKDNTAITASDLIMEYNTGANFKATVTNALGKPAAGATVKFQIEGETKVYTRTADANGVASITINRIPGTYVMNAVYDNVKVSKNIIVLKQVVTLSASDLNVELNGKGPFKVTVKNKNGGVIGNVNVIIDINGVKYSAKSDSKGIASLDVSPITKNYGIYQVKSYVPENDIGYSSNTINNKITVAGYILSGNDISISAKDTNVKYSATLTDTNKKPISGQNINFVVKDSKGNQIGSTLTGKTNSNGVATVTLPKLDLGVYSIEFTYTPTGKSPVSAKKTITVSDGIPLSAIKTSANNLKKYIESNSKLPNTVTVDGKVYSTADFLYLLAKATIALNNKDSGSIQPLDINDPAKPSIKTVTGNLYLKDYLVTAQDIIDYAVKNGIAPDSLKTALGESGYEPLVYAFARVVAYYENNGMMPNYVSLKAVTVPTPTSPLNSPNTIPESEMYKYLESGGWKCDVNNTQIKALAAQLTAGKTTDLAKATAIFNYVRDKISYSFYYDTRYGATNTLFVKKTGNCCDKSNAYVALCRAAGLYVRYVHGTCTFSGGTYGHVWTQVLIGDTWTVADTTSSRNSFGDVKNWNNYNYQLKGYYAQLAF